jgi:hypothetical protein
MPIRQSIWKVGNTPQPLAAARLASEQQLEDMIVANPELLSDELMLIGRQEDTGRGGRIDLLAISPDGSLTLVELKRDRTPREVVAQALDYASWVEELDSDEIAAIYARFKPDGNLSADFQERFGVELDEEALNASHQVIVVAASLDDSTERIIGYLGSRGVSINVLFFQVFEHGTDKFFSRAWLIDPIQSQAEPTERGAKEPWNGEFYASYGPDDARPWDDARKFGFISGGGGSWYSRTLELLNPGDRVWVKAPGHGYIGVGIVTGKRQPVAEFRVPTPQGEQLYVDVSSIDKRLRKHLDDPEMCEYFVPVKWLETRDIDQAVRGIGLFGNQNTVCKPRSKKWRTTVDRLKQIFTKWNRNG